MIKSFYVTLPYNVRDNDHFKPVIDIYNSLQVYCKTMEETMKIMCAATDEQVKANIKLLEDNIQWDFQLHVIIPDTVKKPWYPYKIVATAKINGEDLTPEQINLLSYNKEFKTVREGFDFNIINNVMVTDGGGYLIKHVRNGQLLTNHEVELFHDKIVPDKFKEFGKFSDVY